MQNALTIHPKVSAAALAGALVLIIVYALQTFAHVVLPAEVSAALTVVFTFAAGWLAPASPASTATAATAAAIPTESATT